MSGRVKSAFFGVAAMTSLLAAGAAQADHVSLGLGFSDCSGNYFSLGVNTRPRPVPPPVVVVPAPVVYARPVPVVYAQPAPVVYAQPAPVVYAQPATVVYAQPAPVVVQPGGYWVEADNSVWVEGIWVDFTDEWGHHGRRQMPGHWENHHSREWRPQGGGFGGGDHSRGPQHGGGFGGGDHNGPGRR